MTTFATTTGQEVQVNDQNDTSKHSSSCRLGGLWALTVTVYKSAIVKNFLKLVFNLTFQISTLQWVYHSFCLPWVRKTAVN